jgi:hypothetical protein
LKSLAFLAAAAALFAACNHAQTAPTETSAPPGDPGVTGEGDPSPGEGVDEALSPPAELEVEAWHRVPGLTGIALRSCAALPDGLTKCAFSGANGFEAHVIYRAFDSSAATQFECESRAGAAAGPTLMLGSGFSRWETSDSVLAATDSLCFAVQVFQNGSLDREESLRVGTELAENAASLARAPIE